MPGRAIWKGTIRFARFEVPVKLYSAVRRGGEVEFHLLHGKDRVRVRQEMVCEKKDRPVPDDEIVRGLETGEGEYVLLDEEDLESLKPECDRDIEVIQFVSPEEVSPLHFERPYYLGPDEDEERAYASLARALSESGRNAICRWCFRNRSYNGMLFTREGVLRVVTLRLPGEIRDAAELEIPGEKPSKKEMKTASYLVGELSDEFAASNFRNDFRKELEKMIARKAKGGKIRKRKGPKRKRTESGELLEALEKSLRQARA